MRIKEKYTANRLNATDEELWDDVILPFSDLFMSLIIQETHLSVAQKRVDGLKRLQGR